MPRLIALLSFVLGFPWKDILSAVLTFLYSIAHYIGMLAVYLLGQILPVAKIPPDLVDPLGYLVLLTAFLILVQIAKKIAWIIVIVAWALIVLRIILGLIGY
jgi:hypothetical protein